MEKRQKRCDRLRINVCDFRLQFPPLENLLLRKKCRFENIYNILCIMKSLCCAFNRGGVQENTFSMKIVLIIIDPLKAERKDFTPQRLNTQRSVNILSKTLWKIFCRRKCGMKGISSQTLETWNTPTVTDMRKDLLAPTPPSTPHQDSPPHHTTPRQHTTSHHTIKSRTACPKEMLDNKI